MEGELNWNAEKEKIVKRMTKLEKKANSVNETPTAGASNDDKAFEKKDPEIMRKATVTWADGKWRKNNWQKSSETFWKQYAKICTRTPRHREAWTFEGWMKVHTDAKHLALPPVTASNSVSAGWNENDFVLQQKLSKTSEGDATAVKRWH